MSTERLCGLIALLLACAAMGFQGDEPASVAWSAGDGVNHYGR